MADTPFVHLHTHSDYSFLDGAIPVPKMVARAKELGMSSLAITDHGSLFGACHFCAEAVKAGIKPIIGYEAYVSPTSRLEKKTIGPNNKRYYHLVLLVKNEIGYRNLIKLASLAYIEGFYYKPRIDKEILAQYSEGLIGMSACIGGEIPQLLINKNREGAVNVLREYQEIFGKDDFYLEIQNHGIDDEIIANEELIRMAREFSVPLVATNDAHYLNQEDWEAHDALLCIETKRKVSDVNRYRFNTDQLYFKTGTEMAELFKDVPEAIENTLAIADKCNYTITKGSLNWPTAPKPEGITDDVIYLKQLTYDALKEKFPNPSKEEEEELIKRIELELSVMEEMSATGYMIIVRDFIHEARKMGVPVGPGRGSCVGSLVSYLIGITTIDPLKYDLLFERFLNPERVSMPDIDIDFADKGRAKVIDYVVEKYGKENVCQIGTIGRMQAKNSLKDLARVLDIPIADANLACKLFDAAENNAKGKKDLIIAQDNQAFSEFMSSNNEFKKWMKFASTLEGLNRQPGVHAAGVIICPKPVVSFSPLYQPKSADMLVTQYDGHYVEEPVGLLKMDFLGLRTLSVISDAEKMIKEKYDIEVDTENVDVDDPKTYDVFSRGSTVGVFQFESGGMQGYLRKLKPNCLPDLIAMNALFRPGPMAYIDSFIHRKHGVEKIDYYHDSLTDCLRDTYGIIVYQEQVMKIAQIIGGFSLGKADIMRRAMGKKKIDEMNKMKVDFDEGAKKNKIDKETSDRIWDDLFKFSSYGFNKSHAAAYAFVAFQTAWLKAHYPAELMASNLTSELNKPDRLPILLGECKKMKLKVKPPCVNSGGLFFTVVDGDIIYGMNAIKGVGEAPVESIIKEREEEGPYKTIFDLCCRLSTSSMNKRVLEALIQGGALDCLEGNRSQQFASIGMALDYAASFQKDRDSGQTSLFGSMGDEDAHEVLKEPGLPDVEPWSFASLLKREKTVISAYITGHPLNEYSDEISSLSDMDFSLPEDDKVHFNSAGVGEEDNGYGRAKKRGPMKVVGGIFTAVMTRQDKNGNTFAICEMEDFKGTAEVLIWSDTYSACADLIRVDAVVMMSAEYEFTAEKKHKFIAKSFLKISEARETLAKSVRIRIDTDGLEEEHLKEIKLLCKKYEGPCTFFLVVKPKSGAEIIVKSRNTKVSSSKEFFLRLRDIVGDENVWMEKKY